MKEVTNKILKHFQNKDHKHPYARFKSSRQFPGELAVAPAVPEHLLH